MSIDAKGIQHVLCRIITFSGSCYRYVRKYPVVPCFLIFVFVLYICFPLLFHYLICYSPILVSTFVPITFYFKTKYPEFQWIKRQNSDQRSYVDVDRSIRPSRQNLKSVRRNARMEVPEWDRKDFEELNKFSPRSSLFSNNTNDLDENSKLIFDEKGRDSMEHGVNSSSVETGNDRPLDDPNSVSSDSFQGQSGRGPHGGGGAQVEVESTGEEEEAHDEGKKTIEWTEDDQNSVMVLGTLESERNQRLESLMAKRRERKLFKMAVDKSLMKLDAILPSHLAPILTGVPTNPYEEILRMPGSAPSVMMPTQNPFDIPYDPHEEKPDLMADPNDAQYNHYYSTQRTLVEGPTDPRFKWQSGNHNEAINSTKGKHKMIRKQTMDGIEVEGDKMITHHESELRMDICRNEIKMDTDSINNNDSCCASSSEDTESVLDQTSEYPGICRDQRRKAFNLLVPPKGKTVSTLPYDFSPSPSERPRPDFNLYYSTRHHPTSTCSIASDLQVEVSEIGSPPLTTDGIISSVDGDSVTYEGDVDRDINSDSEEVWGDSFNLSRGEANAEKLRELRDIIEEDSFEVELSGLKRKLEDPYVLPSPSEQEAKNSTQNLETKHETGDEPNSVQSRDNSLENNVSGSKQKINCSIDQISDNSFSSPRSVLPQNNLEDDITHSDVQKSQENLTLENARKLAGNSIDQLSSNSSLGTSERSSNTKKETTDYYKSADRMNKLALEDTQGMTDSSIQSSDGELKSLMISKDVEELSRPFCESNTAFTEHLEGGSQKLAGHGTGIDPSASEEKNAKSDGPETMVVKEKGLSSLAKVILEGNMVANINNSVVNMKDERAVPVMELSKAAGLATAQSVETERLAEAKANAGLSTSGGDSNSLNDIKNGEDMQILTGHDSIIDAPRSKEDKHKAIDHKAATEALKPTETEGKLVKSE